MDPFHHGGGIARAVRPGAAARRDQSNAYDPADTALGFVGGMLSAARASSVVCRLQLRNDGKEYSLRVMVHPSILERLRSEDADLLVRMEKLFGVKLAFRADLNYHVENFKIINAITGEEYR